jgi:hypothetical protein
MAHKIYSRSANVPKCPRCGSDTIRLATYHFGSTYMAECFNCSFGTSNGCDESMAISRYRGQVMEYAGPTKLEEAD